MPRPRSPEGKNVNVCVKVSDAMLKAIDTARGEQSLSDWGRDAFLAALSPQPGPQPGAPVRATWSGPADCAHRGLNPGAWCKTCQSIVPERKKR